MLRISDHAMQHGFSITELMIAVAIVGLVTVLGIPSYKAFIQNTRIRNAAESIQNGLQTARAEAVKRNLAVQFVLVGTDSGWTVGCVTPTATCPAVIQSRSRDDGSSASIIVTPSPAGATTAVFSNLGTLQTTPAPATPALTQINVDIDPALLSAADSRDLRVTIGLGGNTRMCDPNLPSSDSRSCG